jgi:HPt (histidine-containing phosphotransfer) domain-containing protein
MINQFNNEYQNDTTSYFKTTHLLKGVTGTIGAMKLYDLLVEIEQNRENHELLDINHNNFNKSHDELLEFIDKLEKIN